MATNQLSRKEQWTTKLNMRLCPASLLAVVIVASLPYISTLTLPSGDPAPGRSPGPPETELYADVDTVANESSEVTTEREVTSVASEMGACAFARVASESEVVTVSETDSEVNLTVGHAVFDTEQLVRGVVYDGMIRAGARATLVDDVDDIFSSIIGPVFNMRTPHAISNNTVTVRPTALGSRSLEPPRLNQTQKFFKPLLHRAPLPLLTQEDDEEEGGRRVQRFNMVAQNKFQLDKMLRPHVPSLPQFDTDFFELTTVQFKRLHAQYQKRQNIEKKLGILRARRQYIEPPLNFVTNKLIPAKLKQMTQGHWAYSTAGAINVLSNYYFSDREALKRSLRLMAQFIYGAQYKFIYGQTLKRRYSKNVKFRIGYTFGGLEILRQQIYTIYRTMRAVHLHPGFGTDSPENMMTYIKLFEKSNQLVLEFIDNYDFLRELEEKRNKISHILASRHENEKLG